PVNGWDSTATNMNLRIPYINRCWWDSNVDVGVCNLKENPFTSTAIAKKPIATALDTAVQKDGTPVAFTGFPLTFLQPITSQGVIGGYQGAEESIGPKVMVVDKNAWPGASGSPVYNAGGKILGIVVQRGFNDATGLAFVRTSAFIDRFLSQNKKSRQEE